MVHPRIEERINEVAREHALNAPVEQIEAELKEALEAEGSSLEEAHEHFHNFLHSLENNK